VIAWVKNLWRWIRREALIERLAADLDRQRSTAQLNFTRWQDALDAISKSAPLRSGLARVTLERDEALRKLTAYLADVPATAEETPWSAEDSKALAHFLDVVPVGKKLAQHLGNRLADYDRAAVLYSTSGDAWARLKRAHGFRDCRGEILRLSATGPTPGQDETSGPALPPELENLRA
jgi:hypothetical protein